MHASSTASSGTVPRCASLRFLHDTTILRPLLESKSGQIIPTAFKAENVLPMTGTGTNVSGHVERVQKTPRSLRKLSLTKVSILWL